MNWVAVAFVSTKRNARTDVQGSGFSQLKMHEQFGFLLEAMDYGFPLHGGLAIGLDRFVMLLAGEDNIREVIAFRKNNKASDPMTQAPSMACLSTIRGIGFRY